MHHKLYNWHTNGNTWGNFNTPTNIYGQLILGWMFFKLKCQYLCSSHLFQTYLFLRWLEKNWKWNFEFESLRISRAEDSLGAVYHVASWGRGIQASVQTIRMPNDILFLLKWCHEISAILQNWLWLETTSMLIRRNFSKWDDDLTHLRKTNEPHDTMWVMYCTHQSQEHTKDYRQFYQGVEKFYKLIFTSSTVMAGTIHKAGFMVLDSMPLLPQFEEMQQFFFTVICKI